MQVLQLTDLRLRRAAAPRPGRGHAAVSRPADRRHRFFRDPEAFEALAGIIPRLFEGKGPDDTVRVWVPGCATGEEVYSIAILLREHMDKLGVPPKVQVFGTDIDDAALAVARAARYPAGSFAGVSPERLQRFFREDGGVYELRRRCATCASSRRTASSATRRSPARSGQLPQPADLLRRRPPVQGHAGVPLCAAPGRLPVSGCLRERVAAHGPVRGRRQAAPAVPAPRPSVTQPQLPLLLAGSRALPSRRTHRAGDPGSRRRPAAQIESRVLERFGPAHVVVNRDGDVLLYSPRTGRYLEQPPGQPSRQLLAMARKGLRLELRGALQEAARRGGWCRASGSPSRARTASSWWT